MRRYQITVNGRTFEVRLLSDPQQDKVQVEVDGHTLVVQVETVASEDAASRATPASGRIDHRPTSLTTAFCACPLPSHASALTAAVSVNTRR